MAIGDIIVGIDIGSSKVSLVMGEVNNFNQIEVICSTSEKCKGIKKSIIIDEDEIALAISKVIQNAEEEANLKINSAYVTIPGKYVTIVQNSITKDVKDKYAGISTKDVASSIIQVKDIDVPEGKNIIDIVADQFILEDGKIVGKGTHQELMKNNETYRQIALSQLSKEELDIEGGTEHE